MAAVRLLLVIFGAPFVYFGGMTVSIVLFNKGGRAFANDHVDRRDLGVPGGPY